MYHTDKFGNQKPLFLLEDTHLSNIIKMYIRKADNARAVIDGKISNKYLKAINNLDIDDEESAIDFIEEFEETIAPYIMEACIRGLDFKDELKRVFGRDEIKSGIQCLPNYDEVDF